MQLQIADNNCQIPLQFMVQLF